MAICGLDFGTSNTTLGILDGGAPTLVALEAGETTIPSAVFYARDSHPEIGRAAVGAYVEGVPGRLMRSLKSVLGSTLQEEPTQLGRRRVRFREIIGEYLGAVKERAEAACGHRLTAVVHGRPVHFVDDDDAGDRKAEEALGEIARGIGFRQVSFQFEPIAAALDYERSLDHEEVAMIADIGGGTSDFSIVRLGPERHHRPDRSEDILANDGVRIGGTDFDRQLSLKSVMPLLGYRSAMKRGDLEVPLGYFHDLATWATINRLYEPRVLREIRDVRREASHPALLDRLIRTIEAERGHTLAIAVERAKIALSEQPSTAIDLDWIEETLQAPLAREDLARHTGTLAERIRDRLADCRRQAGVPAERIDALFLTGGSTGLAHVRAALVEAAPSARVVEGDKFGSVGTGLAIEAQRRYG
jgi:hypothetical chaperone protein